MTTAFVACLSLTPKRPQRTDYKQPTSPHHSSTERPGCGTRRERRCRRSRVIRIGSAPSPSRRTASSWRRARTMERSGCGTRRRKRRCRHSRAIRIGSTPSPSRRTASSQHRASISARLSCRCNGDFKKGCADIQYSGTDFRANNGPEADFSGGYTHVFCSLVSVVDSSLVSGFS